MTSETKQVFFLAIQKSTLKAGSSCISALAHTMNFASGGENALEEPSETPDRKKAFKVRLRNDASPQQDHRAFLKRVSLLSGLFPKGGHTPFGGVWGAEPQIIKLTALRCQN